MSKGDKVSVKYIVTERTAETRSGTVEYISRFGWVAVTRAEAVEAVRDKADVMIKPKRNETNE